MNKYIDAEKLYEYLEQANECYPRYADNIVDNAVSNVIDGIKTCIASLQQEQPMPNSTLLIELWHADKEMLKEKDFRGDPWRLAYNAFMCGFGRGIAVKQQEQPEADLQKIINQTYHDGSVADTDDIDHVAYENIARHFYELGFNARKEEKK